MTEYYYLNEQNTPTGPVSLAQLADMMASGRVNPTTLVARKGDASWEPLGSVLSREKVEPEETPALPEVPGAQVGNCPVCRRSLAQDMVNGQLPTSCPNCDHPFRPEKSGIWANFCMAMRQYATFRGRATRAEFWSFTLVNCLIMIFLYVAFFGIMVAMAIGLVQAEGDLADQFQHLEQSIDNKDMMNSWGVWYLVAGIAMMMLGIVALVWCLAMLIPSIAVTVRRLHDVGWSGLWVLGYVVSMFIFPAMTYPLYLPSSEGAPMPTAMVLLSLVHAAYCAYALLLLVLMFIDSQRGPNEYGPSRKYPLG